MKDADRIKYEARARIAKALAHPTRLLLVDLLRGLERSVGDLTEAAGADQSTISRHLAVLREVGLVNVRKAGTTSLFSLQCDCIDSLFTCFEQVLQCDLSARQRAVTVELTYE